MFECVLCVSVYECVSVCVMGLFFKCLPYLVEKV